MWINDFDMFMLAQVDRDWVQNLHRVFSKDNLQTLNIEKFEEHYEDWHWHILYIVLHNREMIKWKYYKQLTFNFMQIIYSHHFIKISS